MKTEELIAWMHDFKRRRDIAESKKNRSKWGWLKQLEFVQSLGRGVVAKNLRNRRRRILKRITNRMRRS